MFLFSALHVSTFKRITKYRSLCVCFTCCLYFFLSLSYFFVNLATTKTVNVDEWFESLESFISIISIFPNFWIYMSRHMNQTYIECYAFDVNVVLKLIALIIRNWSLHHFSEDYWKKITSFKNISISFHFIVYRKYLIDGLKQKAYFNR